MSWTRNRRFTLLCCLVTKYCLLLSKIQMCLCRHVKFSKFFFDNYTICCFLARFKKRTSNPSVCPYEPADVTVRHMNRTQNQKAVRHCTPLHICTPITQLLMFIPFSVYQYCSNTYSQLFWAWVCGHTVVGIAGSNPSGVMDVCLLCVLLLQSPLYRNIQNIEPNFQQWRSFYLEFSCSLLQTILY